MSDLAYAWRRLRRTPGFTIVATLTLALGIGANAVFFAVVDAMLWRPTRALDLDHTYSVELARPATRPAPGVPRTNARQWYPLTSAQIEYLAARPELGIVAGAASSPRTVIAQTATAADRMRVLMVQGHYAATFAMRPIAGQLTGLQNDGATAGPSVVISERLWRTWFRGDRAIVGRDQIRLNGRSFTVAGVVPGAQAITGADLWMAAESWPAEDNNPLAMFSASYLRVRPDMPREKLPALIDRALAAGPDRRAPEYTTAIGSPGAGMISPVAAMSRVTWMVLGLAAIVLVAACANLANMLYARAAQRTGEVAVRLSLGAGASRIFRLFLFEAAIIAALAAAAGAVLAYGGLAWAQTALPGVGLDPNTRLPIDLTPDWRTAAYVLLLGTLAALIVGGLTAWRGSRTPPLRLFGPSGIAGSTTTRGKWTRTLLVAVQVSAAVILVLGTSLYLVESIKRATSYTTFDTDRLATAQLAFADNRFHDSEVPVLLDRILQRVEHLPGIEAAAITDGVFGGAYSGAKSLQNLVAEDEAQPNVSSTWRLLTGVQAAVSPGFLSTMGLELRHGRNLTPNDTAGTPEVVLLSESAVASLWPGAEPIGKRVRLGSDRRWFTVVGVFADPLRNREDSTRLCVACAALTPWAQMPTRNWLVVVRAASPATVVGEIRAAVDAVNPDVAVLKASVGNQSIFVTANADTAFGVIFGSLGMLAMAIAALGVYGVISYSVARRTREFGIRLALGATPRGIVRAILDEAVHLVLVGLLPGVLLASWATRLLENRLVRMMPNDVTTWAAVPIGILLVGVLAAWFPARRAARVDPNVALRDL